MEEMEAEKDRTAKLKIYQKAQSGSAQKHPHLGRLRSAN